LAARLEPAQSPVAAPGAPVLGPVPRLRIYRALSRLPWPRRFSSRLLLVCFLGTHLPLIVLILGMAATIGFSGTGVQFAVALTLGGTLVATGLVLAIVHGALAPIDATRRALADFHADRTISRLPTDHIDEPGRLMACTQATIEGLGRQLTELDGLAHRDPLTGVGNRRWLVREAAARSTEMRALPSSLLLLDLDHFKLVNDRHGHLAGDMVLRELAALITDELGSGAIIARLGGEEFCILMPGVPLEAAARRAEGLRGRIAGHRFAGLPAGEITASFGVVRLRSDDPRLGESFARADLLVYRAKAEGRDRVVVEHVPNV
jgi:diguanylate cyclase (GGDEF)-like protein